MRSSMKRWIRILLPLLCLTFLSAAVFQTAAPVTAEAASVKSGLKKENGNYYYYQSGKKIKNTWKTVKVRKNGKTVSYRYYFGKNGAAYKGTKTLGELDLAFKKINGKYYGFNASAQMLKGTYVKRSSTGRAQFYVFNSKTGVYDSAKTKKLRTASKYEKNAAALRKLLGKPAKTVKLDSCYGSGKDLLLYYTNFIVTLYRSPSGKEIVLDLCGR